MALTAQGCKPFLYSQTSCEIHALYLEPLIQELTASLEPIAVLVWEAPISDQKHE